MILELYRWLTRQMERFAPRWLAHRAKAAKEDPARLNERLGQPSLHRPDGPLVWLHGASVGETLSALPLIEHLLIKRPGLTVLVTSGTVTSAKLLAERLPNGAIHQFAPLDGPSFVDSFLDHWQPQALILVEGELWPNMICALSARHATLALVSARFTQKSARGWSRFGRTARDLLQRFDLIAPQDLASAARLEALGATISEVVNLKLIGAPLDYDRAAFERLSAAAGDRPVIVAASTHPGEEVLIQGAINQIIIDQAARQNEPVQNKPLHLIVPRHPDRADALEDAFLRQGYSVARRSRHDPIAPDLDVYVADTLGEMGLLFRLGDAIVLGGSLVPNIGGHNPLEAARLGKAVISGPEVNNWLGVFEQMEAAKATLIIDRQKLAPAIDAMLHNYELRSGLNNNARRFANARRDEIGTLWRLLEPLLPAAQDKGR